MRRSVVRIVEEDGPRVRECKRNMRDSQQHRDKYYQKAHFGSIFSFQDVEDALKAFSGDKSRSMIRVVRRNCKHVHVARSTEGNFCEKTIERISKNIFEFQLPS